MTTLPNVLAVVQARASSVRLPGKVLKPFGEATLLAHILRRVKRSGLPVWVATSTEPDDDQVASVAAGECDGVYRGSLGDVLGRVVGCLEAAGSPELVVRVCADRPFVDPEIITDMLQHYEDVGRPDYLSNNQPASYPVGLDLEVVRADALRVADAEAPDSYEKEHVTPFLYRRPERFSLVNLPCPYGNFSHVRAVIDVDADYDALRLVAERLGDGGYRELLDLATLEPALFP